MSKQPLEIRVGVFNHLGKTKMRYTAYTLWFNPAWDGCCMHTVLAVNGTEAKRLAIAEHKEKCGE